MGNVRLIMLGFAGVSAAFSITVPLVYGVTLDENQFSAWLDDPTFPAWLALLLVSVVLVVIPTTLVLGALILRQSGFMRTRHGLIVGAVLGMWASAAFLIVPYVGAYPSLPAALIGALLSGWTNIGAWYYLGTIAANAVLWSMVVGLVYRGRGNGVTTEFQGKG